MTDNTKFALMYGAGNIGRGFIGERFYLSGYRTVFVDINDDVVNAMNRGGEYPLYITNGGEYDETMIKNVSAINGKDAAATAAMIARCDVAATAVGVNVLPYIAGNLADGIIERYESGKLPLNIIICENMIDCDKYLRSLIKAELDKRGVCADVTAYFADSVGLIEASVGRMVPQTPDYLRERNFLSVCAERYGVLPIDADAIVGELPNIDGVVPKSNFEFYIKRKLYMHNMSHAALAYLGFQKGYEFIAECAEDEEIIAVVKGALSESAAALSAEFGADITELDEHAADLLHRFKNKLLGDTVARVGKDTIRKLSPKDRLTGAYMLARKHTIGGENIYRGIKAALKFAPPPDFDPQSHEVSEYAKAHGEAEAMKKYCGITPHSTAVRIHQLSQRGNRSQMMSYVIEIESCDEKHIVVIDGGTKNDAEYLHGYLQGLCGEIPRVDLWILTHAHSDHTDAFYEIVKNYSGDFVIEKLMYNFPSADITAEHDPHGSADAIRMLEQLLPQIEKDTRVIKAEQGAILTVGGASFEILYTPRTPSPEFTVNIANNASTVIRMESMGQSVLFLADLGEEAGAKMLKTVPHEKIKSDFVQMAHHGQSGVSREFYDVCAPRACLWCTPEWLWNNDAGGGYNTHTWTTVETREWMAAVKHHFIAKDGTKIIELPYTFR